MSALYVHIPFCASRCIYCGFYSTTGLNLQSSYIDAVIKELKLRLSQHPEWQEEQWETIYFGGGTPSTLPTPYLNKLITGISETLGLHPKGTASKASNHPTDLSDSGNTLEWTMECNPDDITPAFANWLTNTPVNRISMGVQSFNDDRLRWLHRRHTSSQVKEAVSLLRSAGINNISLDLMFGFPNQTLDEWKLDIDEILTHNPEHISAYSLMYEEGTPLYQMLEQGKISEIDEELSLKMYNTLIDRLTSAGYEHYEISNFAKPGYRSRHNSSYWHQVHYLGIGAAAHSYDGNQRWWNVSDIKGYIDAISSGILPSESEDIDDTTRYNDIITTALRTREGIDITTLPGNQRKYLLAQAQPHIQQKRLALNANRLCLTRQGIFTSDDIMSDLILLT